MGSRDGRRSGKESLLPTGTQVLPGRHQLASLCLWEMPLDGESFGLRSVLVHFLSAGWGHGCPGVYQTFLTGVSARVFFGRV